MAFLAPLFFVGLAALAIPVLIHLTQREKKMVQQFPSLMFVRRIPYQTVRRRKLRDILLLMVRLAAKDTSTEKHTRRVASLAVEVGEQLGLSAGRLRSLAIGGLLHDMGKLSVPDAILQKPGPLDDDEFAQVKLHPQRGRELLAELGGFDEGVKRLVLDHHERLDGTGYPRGVEGGDLDLETRILAVCDVYDALVSARVYRPAWSRDEALELLRNEADVGFDGRCVKALEHVLEGRTNVVERTPSPQFVASRAR